MTKLIRNGMFETNSSSTHSLVINPEDEGVLDTDLGTKEQKLKVKPVDYEEIHGKKTLATSQQKLPYLVTFALGNKENIAKLAKVILQTTGQILQIEDSYESGQTHNLSEDWEEDAFEDSKKLKRVLFDPSYHILLNNWPMFDDGNWEPTFL